MDKTYALFTRISPQGTLEAWRFEGFVATEEEAQEIEARVKEENDPYDFRYVELPL